MKVIHVIDSGGIYGAEIMLLNLVEAQLVLGLEVEVISIGLPDDVRKSVEEELTKNGYIVHPLRMPARPSIKHAMKIISICKARGASIVHSHGYKGNILLGLIPRYFRRIPAVTTLHGYTRHSLLSKMTLNQLLDKIMLRFIDAIVFVSPAIKINMWGLKRKSSIIFNGIKNHAVETATTESEATRSKPKDNQLIIGSIGRLCSEKNFSFLINQLPNVLKLFPNVKLIIHGEGPDRNNLEQLILKLRLNDYIELPGYIKDPHSFLQSIDLYINCSTTEGMPITLLEAMRARCPILASNIPANVFLLQDSAENSVFSLTTQSFISKFGDYLNEKKDIQEHMTQKLYEKFSQSYTSSVMASKYRDIYSRLIKND